MHLTKFLYCVGSTLATGRRVTKRSDLSFKAHKNDTCAQCWPLGLTHKRLTVDGSCNCLHTRTLCVYPAMYPFHCLQRAKSASLLWIKSEGTTTWLTPKSTPCGSKLKIAYWWVLKFLKIEKLQQFMLKTRYLCFYAPLFP